MNKNKAIVVFSGGQDSTTCLFWAMEKFASVETITFDYGQRHSDEIRCAEDICQRFSIPNETIPVSSIKALGGNALTRDEIAVQETVSEGELPNTFVPGRNILFLTLAAARAYQAGVYDLVTGVGQADYSGYPDCREDFIQSLERTLELGMESTFKIHRPLMFKDKSEIWALSDQLGHLQDIVKLTHTCYNGVRNTLYSWGYGCGECPACKLRKAGYEKYMERRDAVSTE